MTRIWKTTFLRKLATLKVSMNFGNINMEWKYGNMMIRQFVPFSWYLFCSRLLPDPLGAGGGGLALLLLFLCDQPWLQAKSFKELKDTFTRRFFRAY